MNSHVQLSCHWEGSIHEALEMHPHVLRIANMFIFHLNLRQIATMGYIQVHILNGYTQCFDQKNYFMCLEYIKKKQNTHTLWSDEHTIRVRVRHVRSKRRSYNVHSCLCCRCASCILWFVFPVLIFGKFYITIWVHVRNSFYQQSNIIWISFPLFQLKYNLQWFIVWFLVHLFHCILHRQKTYFIWIF